MRRKRQPTSRIQGRPVTGEAQSPAQRMRRYRARRRAAGFRLVTRYEAPPRARLTASELDQRIIQARALALHCLAAKKIDEDRALLTRVQRRIDYWRRNAEPLADVDVWDKVLSRPWAEIAIFITDPGVEAAQLRRISPFDIVLSPPERRRVYAAFAAR